MLGVMSLGHSLTSSSLDSVGNWVPWQFRARPALFVSVGLSIAVLLSVGLLISARRLLGALATDLSPDAMLVTALVSAMLVAFARIAWRRNFPLETPADLSFTDQLLGYGSSVALALLAVGCCYPANRTVDWLIWLPILVADQLWRQNFFDAGEPWVPASADSEFENAELLMPTIMTPTTLAIAASPQHDDIVQQLYRIRDEQDCELIYGTLRADFVAGQRTAVVHVGFCPPLAYLPEIEAEVLPGSVAKIKVAQATRLDVRLSAPAATDCQVWIDMAARPIGAFAQVKIA